MKKIFTLIAVAAMAICANAQSLLTFTSGMTEYKSEDGKIELTATGLTPSIDSNSQYFGLGNGTNVTNMMATDTFANRFKTGAKSTSAKYLTLKVAETGKLYIFARSASSNAARAITLTHNETELLNQSLNEELAGKVTTSEGEKSVFKAYEVNLTSTDDITITFANGAINIYGISLNYDIPAYSPSSTQAPVAEVAAPAAVKTAKGVVKNGQKFDYAGQRVK